MFVYSEGLGEGEGRREKETVCCFSNFEGQRTAKTNVLSCLIQLINYASVQSLTLHTEKINILAVLVQSLYMFHFFSDLHPSPHFPIQLIPAWQHKSSWFLLKVS